MLTQLANLIMELNTGAECEVSEYNPHTNSQWISIRKVAPPLKQTLTLPPKAFWYDDNTIEYNGRKIKAIPFT